MGDNSRVCTWILIHVHWIKTNVINELGTILLHVYNIYTSYEFKLVHKHERHLFKVTTLSELLYKVLIYWVDWILTNLYMQLHKYYYRNKKWMPLIWIILLGKFMQTSIQLVNCIQATCGDYVNYIKLVHNYNYNT